MDPITHILITYCLIFWIQKFRPIPKTFLIPFLIGSVIPDLDVAFNFLTYYVPKLFWLEHRAMSHSFVGIIPYVIGVSAVLTIPKIKNTFFPEKKYPELKFWSWTGVIALYLGALAHFLPDFFVPTRMMLLFPFSFQWYGINILSTANIHTIAALFAVVTFWPLKWDKRQRNIALSFFLIVFVFYSSVRVAVNVRSTDLFETKYGPGSFSSNELLYTYNVNYKIANATDPQNKTYLVTISHGLQKRFVVEEMIPEITILGNIANKTLALSLVNLSKENSHYHRMWQKYQIVCAEVKKDNHNSWTVKWFAPIREAEKRVKTDSYDYRSSIEVIFHFLENGTITKIERPIYI